jgi:hypothetical protein
MTSDASNGPPDGSRGGGGEARRRLAPLLAFLLLLTGAGAGCRSRARTEPAPDPTPVLGVWTGREGRPFNRFREWQLEIKRENLPEPGKRRVPGVGRYTEGGVVCEVRFFADYYPGAVPRVNFAMAGHSENCDLQRFTLYTALPIADTMVGQLSEQRDEQYASVTFRRSAGPTGAP